MADDSSLTCGQKTLSRRIPSSCPHGKILSSTKCPFTLSSIFGSPGVYEHSTVVKKCARGRTLFQTLIPTAHCFSGVNENSSGFEVEDKEGLPGFQTRTKTSSQLRQKQDQISALEINMWLNQETGFQRLQQAYAIGNFPGMGMFKQQDTQDVSSFVFYAGLFGFVVSWINAALTHASFEGGSMPKNLSQSQALMKGLYVDKTIPLKVLRETLRNGGLFTLQAVGMFHLPHMIATYRNETTIWDFFASSVITYGCHNLSKCPINLLKNVGKGAVVGAIYGYFMTTYLTTQGLTQEERHFERVRQILLNNRSSIGVDY